MYEGYLAIDGVELINAARTMAYVKANLPGINIKYDSDTLRDSLGHSEYLSPIQDNAPWYKASRLPTADFYGIFPGKILGLDDSTRKLTVTELISDGAVHSMARFGSKEVRVTAVAIAKTATAMNEGLAWVRDVLDGDCVDGQGLSCNGREVRMFAAKPPSRVEAVGMWRSLFEVEVLEAPVIAQQFNSKHAVMWEIEFTLSAGKPWLFTDPAQVATLDMNSGLNFQDPDGEDCSVASTVYDDFINDPFFTGIVPPPQPDIVRPPNLLDITSWRRLEAVIQANQSDRWGRMVPVVTISTAATAAQFLRLRFYKVGHAGCDYTGEFVVSYIPANTILTLDGRRREAYATLTDGRQVPASHLLFGSNGTPFQWPSMGCHATYKLSADLMPGQQDVIVMLDVAVRE